MNRSDNVLLARTQRNQLHCGNSGTFMNPFWIPRIIRMCNCIVGYILTVSKSRMLSFKKNCASDLGNISLTCSFRFNRLLWSFEPKPLLAASHFIIVNQGCTLKFKFTLQRHVPCMLIGRETWMTQKQFVWAKNLNKSSLIIQYFCSDKQGRHYLYLKPRIPVRILILYFTLLPNTKHIAVKFHLHNHFPQDPWEKDTSQSTSLQPGHIPHLWDT